MHKLRYIALGGLLMFVGMLTASVLMPNLAAQRDKFGECRRLAIVDENGINRILLGVAEDSASFSIISKYDESKMILREDGGEGQIHLFGPMVVYGTNREPAAVLKAEGHSGHINLYNNGQMAILDGNVAPVVKLVAGKGFGWILVNRKNGEVDIVGGY